MRITKHVTESTFDAPSSELFAWHARPGAFERLAPPWAPPRVVAREGDVREGRVVLEVPMGPVTRTWIAEHRDYVEGRRFRDVQVRGPFAAWTHTHEVEPIDERRSRLRDSVEYALPLGPLGALGRGFAERELDRLFAFRHARTAADLDRHRGLLAGPRLSVAITGASGLVGRALAAFLGTGGHEARRLVRREAKAPDEIAWDPTRGEIDVRALEGLRGVDAIVHLAGENVGDARWTDARKARILSSRVEGTRAVVDAIRRLDRKPVLVSASAIGLYGDRGDEILDERAAPGTGFLAEVVRAWEAEASRAREVTRVALPRIGVVTTMLGGALAKMHRPFAMGVGGPIGGGRQWMSWVSLDDVLDAIVLAIRRPELEGPFHVVAPNPVTQRDFAKTLGRVLRRPAIAPVPAFALRALFGELGSVVLESQRVVPARLQELGFTFRFPDLEPLLRFELGG